ncbi:MAG: BlaI/MecI/CopY family transcriptional regulator [Aeriscardovia sp.]|nr:BlaI/MecI/CopY family transcriptional regulator [Aeriscardovia sp.]
MTSCKCSISGCEWQVMALLWQGPSCSREICGKCADKFGWSPSTVKTYLSRLVKKGFAEAEKKRGCFEYRAKKSQGECMQERTEKLAEETCLCDQKAMILNLIKNCPLSPKDAEEIKKALDEKISRAHEDGEIERCRCKGGKNGCGC